MGECVAFRQCINSKAKRFETKYKKSSPAMIEGLLDRKLSIEELLMMKIPAPNSLEQCRVSTLDQNTELQKTALMSKYPDGIYREEKKSGLVMPTERFLIFLWM